MDRKDMGRYWSLAKDCRDAMKRYGRAVLDADWDRERAAIHDKVGAVDQEGAPLSSKNLSPEQFKAVCKEFLAWARPDDLNAQMEVELGDYQHWRWLADEMLDRIEAMLLAKDRVAEAAPITRGDARDGYLLAMMRRIGKAPDMVFMTTSTPRQRRDVMAALVYRFDQVARKGRGKGETSPVTSRAGKPPLQRPFDVLAPMPGAVAAKAQGAPVLVDQSPEGEEGEDPF